MWPRDESSTTTGVEPAAFDLPEGAADLRPMPTLKAQPSTVDIAPDIRALTTAVRRGEAEAFSRFYDLYSFRLYKYLLVLAHGEQGDAREVCHALCASARNAFIDYCRARQRLNRFVPLDALPAEPNGHPNPEHRLAEILRDTLAAWPPEERELIQAAYVDNRPLQGLADEAGLTYKAIESRLGRLRHKLKQQLLNDLRHENEC